MKKKVLLLCIALFISALVQTAWAKTELTSFRTWFQDGHGRKSDVVQDERIDDLNFLHFEIEFSAPDWRYADKFIEITIYNEGRKVLWKFPVKLSTRWSVYLSDGDEWRIRLKGDTYVIEGVCTYRYDKDGRRWCFDRDKKKYTLDTRPIVPDGVRITNEWDENEFPKSEIVRDEMRQR